MPEKQSKHLYLAVVADGKETLYELYGNDPQAIADLLLKDRAGSSGDIGIGTKDRLGRDVFIAIYTDKTSSIKLTVGPDWSPKND